MVMRRHDISVRKAQQEGLVEGKSDGMMKGFPLSIPSTPVSAQSDHLEKEAARRKLDSSPQ